MSLNRSEKQAVIEEVTGLAAKAQTLVMAEYRGITVADMTKLRNDARGVWVRATCSVADKPSKKINNDPILRPVTCHGPTSMFA